DLFRKRYPVTDPRHRDQIMMLAGVKTVLEALRQSGSNLPGMVLATALAEGVAAKEQVTLSGMVYRAAARAGADMTRITAIYTEYDGDGLAMVLESETEQETE